MLTQRLNKILIVLSVIAHLAFFISAVKKRKFEKELDPSSPKLASADHIWQVYDTFMFDADGTLWQGDSVLEGAVQLLKSLISAGKRVIIVTNNSTLDANQLAEKCSKMGFEGITAANIVTAGIVLTNYIKKLKASPEYAVYANLPIYLMGSKGLHNMFACNGIESIGQGPDLVSADQQDFNFAQMHRFISDRPVFAVVTAMDMHISYPKIVKAANYLSNPKMPFLAANEEGVFRGLKPGQLIPGPGAISSAIRYVSGREPIVMGKPGRTCWEYICALYGGKEKIEPSRTIMIGDRLDTDILFGHNSELATLLVLTGDTPTLEEAMRMANGNAAMMPNFYAATLMDLLLKNAEH